MNTLNAAGSFHLQNSSSIQLENKLDQKRISEGDIQKLKDACQDFESIFIKNMLDSMKKTIQRSQLSKRSWGEDVFDDMLYDEYAKKMGKSAGLGIGDMMFRQLSTRLPESML